MVMVLILLFMAIETQIWNSDGGGALTSPPALMFVMLEKKRLLVALSSELSVLITILKCWWSLVMVTPRWSRSLPSASRLDRVL